MGRLKITAFVALALTAVAKAPSAHAASYAQQAASTSGGSLSQEATAEAPRKNEPQNESKTNEKSAQENLDNLVSEDAKIRVQVHDHLTDEQKAESLRKAREMEQAVREFGNPGQAQAALNALGVIHTRFGQFGEAVGVLKEIDFRAVQPEQRALYQYNLGRALELSKKPGEAVDLYLQAMQGQPEFTPALDGALRVISDASSAVDQSKSDQVLVLLVRHYADIGLGRKQFESTAWPNLKKQAGATPFWQEGLAELGKAYAGEFPATAPSDVKDIFPAWSRGPGPSQVFSRLLVRLGDMQQYASGESEEGRARQTLAYYLAAWGLDPGNSTAALRAAVTLDDHPVLQGEYLPVLLKAPGGSSTGSESASLQNLSVFHMTLGSILSRSQRCGSKDDSSTPFYHYDQALALEKKARESRSAALHDAAQLQAGPSPGTRREQAGSCAALSPTISASPTLNRRLADCSRQAGDRAAFAGFDKGVECSLRAYRQGSSLEEKWDYHFDLMVYAGSWLRSGVQAGLAQALNTPQKWGQGGKGYGRRLASTHATRTLRQLLAFAVDSPLGEDPHYLLSPRPGFKSRFWFSLKQTFICQNDRLSPTFATWRVASAFGSEFISNSWRPTGNGIGDSSARSALARGLFVLGGDTAGNVFKEFAARKGKLGRLLRPFASTEKGSLRGLINPFAKQ